MVLTKVNGTISLSYFSHRGIVAYRTIFTLYRGGFEINLCGHFYIRRSMRTNRQRPVLLEVDFRLAPHLHIEPFLDRL